MLRVLVASVARGVPSGSPCRVRPCGGVLVSCRAPARRVLVREGRGRRRQGSTTSDARSWAGRRRYEQTSRRDDAALAVDAASAAGARCAGADVIEAIGSGCGSSVRRHVSREIPRVVARPVSAKAMAGRTARLFASRAPISASAEPSPHPPRAREPSRRRLTLRLRRCSRGLDRRRSCSRCSLERRRSPPWRRRSERPSSGSRMVRRSARRRGRAADVDRLRSAGRRG